jgi:murein DD-endopeptidase MepM/ murein hydrolase activator NlpD
MALLALGLAPLQLRQPVTEASATSVSGAGLPEGTTTAAEAKPGPSGTIRRAGVEGTLVPIDPNQSLVALAETFRVDLGQLRRLNGLGASSRLPNQLFIPAVSTDSFPVAPAARTNPSINRERVVRFVWPTHGILTQYFWQYHPGLDIANVVGTPEVAADAGKVVWAGWGDYGLYVEIDHGNGLTTIYAHMSQLSVAKGETVTKGEQVGLMGATGRATGPHLHFEVRYQGIPQNPLDLLP